MKLGFISILWRFMWPSVNGNVLTNQIDIRSEKTHDDIPSRTLSDLSLRKLTNHGTPHCLLSPSFFKKMFFDLRLFVHWLLLRCFLCRPLNACDVTPHFFWRCASSKSVRRPGETVCYFYLPATVAGRWSEFTRHNTKSPAFGWWRVLISIPGLQTHRHTDGWMYRWTDGWTERQTDRQTDR